MEQICKRHHGEVDLLSVYADCPNEWDTSNATNIRVVLPSNLDFMIEMQSRGYQFADRMLNVTISLKQNKIDYEKLIRMKPILIFDRKEEIKRLAQNNFTLDRRFHIDVRYNQEKANSIIADWVDETEGVFVCIYKDKIIGFLVLNEAEDKKSGSIHLAVVEERYRATGAAMSLYANAIQEGIKRGYQKIVGCISSSNTSVMNLYSYLGGTFSNPAEVYLKEVRDDRNN